MQQILEVMKNVTVFILIFSIVSNLFSQSKYHKYFKFIEGIIVILLVMTPMFSWFTSESFLDDCLDKNLFQMEQDVTQDELKMIGERRDEMIRKGVVKDNEG